jgi:hypothetical protein
VLFVEARIRVRGCAPIRYPAARRSRPSAPIQPSADTARCIRYGRYGRGLRPIIDVPQDEPAKVELKGRMPPFIYRCPRTGFRVQGWGPDDESEMVSDAFVSVTCHACGLVHLVNPKAGKTPGEDGE